MSTLSDILKNAGKSKNEKADSFNQEQLAIGIEIEKEHVGNDKQAASEIAKDHLRENPNYYKNLSKIEKEVRDKQKEIKKASTLKDVLKDIK